MKQKTKGVDPKVPIQALATIVAFVAAYFGVDLDAATSGAIAVVLGAVASYFAPAAKTTEVLGKHTSTSPHSEEVRPGWDSEHGFYDPMYVLLFLVVLIVVVWLLLHLFNSSP